MSLFFLGLGIGFFLGVVATSMREDTTWWKE